MTLSRWNAFSQTEGIARPASVTDLAPPAITGGSSSTTESYVDCSSELQAVGAADEAEENGSILMAPECIVPVLPYISLLEMD